MSRYILNHSRDINAVLHGINELDVKKKRLDIERKAQMQELALSLCFPDKDPEKILNILSTIRPAVSSGEESVVERIELCRTLLDQFNDLTYYSIDLSIAEAKPGKKTVGVLDNRYIGLAFQRFSNKEAMEAVSFFSFDEMCESISNGECDYGILPTESSDSGKLLRFYSLIDRHDLKINAVCDISYDDESSTTRYSLVSKFSEFPKSRFGEYDYIEFSINLDNAQRINEIITAASLCSMKLHRIDSIPIAYKEKEFSFCSVFETKNADINTFLLYMYLDFPQYTPIGIFPQM